MTAAVELVTAVLVIIGAAITLIGALGLLACIASTSGCTRLPWEPRSAPRVSFFRR